MQVQEWTDEIEKYISNIGDDCFSYKWMNLFIANKYSSYHKGLNYIVMACGYIAGIFSAMSAIGDNSNQVYQIIVSILSFVVGILTMVMKNAKYEQKTSTHRSLSVKYASLESNIRQQLATARNERVDLATYIKYITSSSDDLFSSMPLIPERVTKMWITYAESNDIPLPERRSLTVTVENVDQQVDEVMELPVSNPAAIERQPESIQRMVTHNSSLKKIQVYDGHDDFNQFNSTRMQYELNRLSTNMNK